jgi:hypothetical protein
MKNRLKQLLTITLISHLSLNSLYGQQLNLKRMIDATSCRDEACFLNAVKDFDICYKRTRTDPTGTYYRHQNCGTDSASDKRLILHFAILKDGNYNSSFLTWSEKYSLSLKEELDQYHFKKMDNPDDPNKSRIWYHSEDYPHMNIMWEVLTDDKNISRWHVGLVWE